LFSTTLLPGGAKKMLLVAAVLDNGRKILGRGII
jgi:hypothetical protein